MKEEVVRRDNHDDKEDRKRVSLKTKWLTLKSLWKHQRKRMFHKVAVLRRKKNLSEENLLKFETGRK